MVRYETLLLAVPEITKDETSSLEKQVDQLIKKAKGSMISFERWGKYRLAYPVRKNEYGVYFLLRFEVENESSHELLHDLNALFSFKKADVVMRNMMTVLDPNQPLTYKSQNHWKIFLLVMLIHSFVRIKWKVSFPKALIMM